MDGEKILKLIQSPYDADYYIGRAIILSQFKERIKSLPLTDFRGKDYYQVNSSLLSNWLGVNFYAFGFLFSPEEVDSV